MNALFCTLDRSSAPLAEGETTTAYADAPAAADASSSASATLAATLYVVDLAGSERADAHAVRTARADAIKKEGGSINQSLLTLRLCVQRLAKAAAAEAAAAGGGSNSNAEDQTRAPPNPPTHVPYRDSKLTRILQPALAGPGRTAVVAAINPAPSQMSETHSTLNFVSTAKTVKMTAKVNAHGLGGGLTREDDAILCELREAAAAEAIRRREVEEEHEVVLEELSRVGGALEDARRAAADAEARADDATERAARWEEKHARTAAEAREARDDAAAARRAATEFENLAAAATREAEAAKTAADAKASEDSARDDARVRAALADAAAARDDADAALTAAARELERIETEKADAIARARVTAEAARACVEREIADAREVGRREATETMTTQLEEALSAFEAMERRVVELSDADAASRARVALAERVCADASASRDEARARCELVERKLAKYKATCDGLEAEAAYLRAKAASDANANAELLASLEDARIEYSMTQRAQTEREEATRRELAAAREAAATRKSALDAAEARVGVLESDNAGLRAAATEKTAENDELVKCLRIDLEAHKREMKAAAERANTQLNAARSAARAAAAGEVAACARADDAALDLQSAMRLSSEAALEAEANIAEFKDIAEAAAMETRILRESNDELVRFLEELEQASLEANEASEAMAAQNERLRRELAEARRAAAVAVAAAGSIPLGGGESASTPTKAAETNANPSTTAAAPTVDLSLFASPDARRRRPKRRTAAPGAEELKAFRASELSVGAGDGDALAGKGAKMHDANACARLCAREEDDDDGKDGGEDDDGKENAEVRSIHWFPYDRVGVVNADP